jgi:hypothetical protein
MFVNLMSLLQVPTTGVNMKTSKPLWLNEPDDEQTSVRFCCPYCFEWIRNRELEEHMKSAHPGIAKLSSTGQLPSLHQFRK